MPSQVIVLKSAPRRRMAGGKLSLKKIGRALGSVNRFLKKSKVISTGLSAFPQTASYGQIAASAGYGRRRRYRRRA